MNVYPLPEFLNGGKRCDMHVHHYCSDSLYVKNKIVLNQNLICILLNGTKEVFGPEHALKIDNTEMLVMRAGNAIMWESIAADKKLASILIFFSDSVLQEICEKHRLDFTAGKNKSKTVINIKKDQYLLAFEQSLGILTPENLAAIQRIKVEELLVYLSMKDGSGGLRSVFGSALTTPASTTLRDVVTANMHRGLSLDELAFLCHMSTSTFKRHFEKAFQCSPKKYFTDRRMEKAKEMLLKNERPSEIYSALRYQNLSSFSTEFKKYFGLSPKQFQQRSE